MGFRPELSGVRSFYDVVFRRRGSGRRLVVIDEYPLLLEAARAADSSLADAVEERDPDADVKLVLCGSQIATMERLLARLVSRAPAEA